MILVGELALWVALLMAAWGAIVSFTGPRADRPELIASGARAIFAAFACLVLATAGLLVALVTSDFSFAYVASVTSANLPLSSRLTALWAGHAGAVLSGTLLVSMFAAIGIAANQMRNRALMPYVAGTLSIILLFFVGVMCFAAGPYERVVPIPLEGRGMHPGLQHPAMAVHPLMMYLGYAAATIPFAFAVAALAARRLDDEWIVTVRRWGTVSWVFLTMGIVSGMWWAYGETGADWLRDPVERLSLFPWLAATAHLGFARRDPKRGTTHRWTILLVVSTVLLAFIAAYVGGRSAPADGSTPREMTVWFWAFPVTTVIASGYLLVTRLTAVRLAVHDAQSFVDKRTRVGRSTLYVGGTVFVVACAGFALGKESEVTLGPGEVATLVDPYRREWTFTSQGLSDYPELNRAVEAVPLRVMHEGRSAGLIVSERRQYVNTRGVPTFAPSIEAGIAHSLLQDTYVALTNIVGDRATMRIAFYPLMTWVWIGAIGIAIGGALLLWPASISRETHV